MIYIYKLIVNSNLVMNITELAHEKKSLVYYGKQLRDRDCISLQTMEKLGHYTSHNYCILFKITTRTLNLV